MKVKELLEALQQCNPEAEVMMWASTSGKNKVEDVKNPNPTSVVAAVTIMGD